MDPPDARDRLMPGEEGHEPENEVEIPVTAGGKHAENGELRKRRAAELRPIVLQALLEGPFGLAERVQDLRLALLIAGLTGNVAHHLAPKALACDGKRRGKNEIGIFRLLRVRVMLQVIAAIGARLRHHRIGTEPLAEK